MELELKFDGAMFEIYRRAKAEAGYNATRYHQMLDEHRGLETARILLQSEGGSEGFAALWEKGRLDLTVEALVLTTEYAPLFTDAELKAARDRLREYGYSFDDARA